MESDLTNNGQERNHDDGRRTMKPLGGRWIGIRPLNNRVCTLSKESRNRLSGNYLLARQCFTIAMFTCADMNLLGFNYNRLERDERPRNRKIMKPGKEQMYGGKKGVDCYRDEWVLNFSSWEMLNRYNHHRCMIYCNLFLFAAIKNIVAIEKETMNKKLNLRF